MELVNQAGFEEGQQLMEEGIARASAFRREAIARAKAIAADLGNKQDLVTIDQVRAIYGPSWVTDLGPAAGGVFKGGLWEKVGIIASCQPKNHARVNYTWRLKSKTTVSLPVAI